MVGVLKEFGNMLAYGRLDLSITLYFTINKGDEFMLHQLLKCGLDPNESDNDGHTTLVCICDDAHACENIFVLSQKFKCSFHFFRAYSRFQRGRTMCHDCLRFSYSCGRSCKLFLNFWTFLGRYAYEWGHTAEIRVDRSILKEPAPDLQFWTGKKTLMRYAPIFVMHFIILLKQVPTTMLHFLQFD